MDLKKTHVNDVLDVIGYAEGLEGCSLSYSTLVLADAWDKLGFASSCRENLRELRSFFLWSCFYGQTNNALR